MSEMSLEDRAALMRRVLGYSTADAALVRDSRKLLEGRVGSLMQAVRQRLLSGEAEEHWFCDDPDISKAFGEALADFVMKVSAADFDLAACQATAGLAAKIDPPAPRSALIVVVGMVGEWVAGSLVDPLYDEPEKLKSTLAAWQKLLAVQLELMLLGSDG